MSRPGCIISGIYNRKNLPNWIKAGQKKTDDKLLEKAREILNTHQPEPLAAEIKNELDRIWENVKSDFKTADHVQRQGAS